MTKITDKEAIKILRRANCTELTESVKSYPEDERDGKSDIEIVRDELDYIVELYEEDGTLLSEDLNISRNILRDTKNGKVILISVKTLKPIYSKYRIDMSKRTVNEYRRLKRLQGTF